MTKNFTCARHGLSLVAAALTALAMGCAQEVEVVTVAANRIVEDAPREDHGRNESGYVKEIEQTLALDRSVSVDELDYQAAPDDLEEPIVSDTAEEVSVGNDEEAPISDVEVNSEPRKKRPTNQEDRLRQIALRSGFDWQAHGVTINIGCSPFQSRCPWGSYDIPTKEIYVSPSILNNSARTEYVILHEVAHAWQFNVRGWPQASKDLLAWGFDGLDGLERAADCLAKLWGSRYLYYGCPEGGVEHMEAIFIASN